MSIETKIPYRVTEKILKAWLQKNIGTDGAGNLRFSYVVSGFGCTC